MDLMSFYAVKETRFAELVCDFHLLQVPLKDVSSYAREGYEIAGYFIQQTASPLQDHVQIPIRTAISVFDPLPVLVSAPYSVVRVSLRPLSVCVEIAPSSAHRADVWQDASIMVRHRLQSEIRSQHDRETRWRMNDEIRNYFVHNDAVCVAR